MRKITITSVSGMVTDVTIDAGAKIVTNEYDGYPMNELNEWLKINAITHSKKGDVKHYLRDFRLRVNDPYPIPVAEKIQDTMDKLEAYGCACGHRTDVALENSIYVTIFLNKENYDKLEKAINDDKAENTTPEARKIIEDKKAKESKEKIEYEENITKEAGRSIRNLDGSLMTEAQAKNWRKNFNDIHNEGGEGYIPYIVTQEQYEDARRSLEKLKMLK